MRIRTAIVVGLLTTLSAQAGVVPFNVFLSSNGTGGAPSSYTIPPGKIYIIESFRPFATTPLPSTTQIRVVVRADNIAASAFQTITILDTYTNSQTVWLPKPFRLKAGESLQIPFNAEYSSFRYFGLLLDEEDLYARNIPVEFDGMDVSEGQLLAEARFASPRPRITRVETATELDEFVVDDSAVEIAGATRDRATFAVDKGDDDQKFLRVRAVARQ